MHRTVGIGVLTTALVLELSMTPAWADGSHASPGEPDARQTERHEAVNGQDGSSAYLVNLSAHAQEVGLGTEQVATLKAIQLDLDLTRVKTEADIMLTEREIAGMLSDERVALSTIEAKINESEAMEAALRVSGVKALRKARALLSPTQHEKLSRVSPLRMPGLRNSISKPEPRGKDLRS